MHDLILFILAVSGLSWVVTRSVIFRPVREFVSGRKISLEKDGALGVKYFFYSQLRELLNCYKCFGFWGGVACYSMMVLGVDFLLYAFAGVAASAILVSFIISLEK